MHRRHCHWNQRPELYHRDIYTDELCALFLPQQRSRGLQPPKSRSWTILLLWWHLIACDRGVLLSRGSFGHGSNQRSQYVHIPLDTDIHSYMAEMYGKGVFGEMHDLHLFTDPGSRTDLSPTSSSFASLGACSVTVALYYTETTRYVSSGFSTPVTTTNPQSYDCIPITSTILITSMSTASPTAPAPPPPGTID